MSVDDSTAKLGRMRDAAVAIAADCALDATRLDETPFTPLGLGSALGEQLAMVAALAEMVAELSTMFAALLVAVTP